MQKGQGDASIKIFLFAKRGEEIDGKTYKLNAQGAPPGVLRPPIHIASKSAAGVAFVNGYTMRLEFGEEKDGIIPSKIYL